MHTTTVARSYDARGNRVGEVTTRTTGGVTHVLNEVTSTYDGANRLVRTHDTGANQNSAKDDVVTTWVRDGLGRALVVTENAALRARVFDGLDVVADGATRVTRAPGGAVLTEAFEQVVGIGRKATTVTVRRDVLADVLGTGVAVATDGVIDADLALFGDFGDLLTAPSWATSTGFTGRTTAGGDHFGYTGDLPEMPEVDLGNMLCRNLAGPLCGLPEITNNPEPLVTPGGTGGSGQRAT